MIEYRTPTDENIGGIIELWRLCFGDDEEIISRFLHSGFHSYVAVNDNVVIAMLHLMNVSLVQEDESINGMYLYAAATLPEYRNMGIMRKLLRFAEDSAAGLGVKFICLMPANDELFDFYEKLGYQKFFKTRFVSKKTGELNKVCKIAENTTKYSFDIIAKLRFNIYGKICGSVLYGNDYIKYAVEMYEHYGASFICGRLGYLLCVKNSKGIIEIFEAACDSREFGLLVQKMLLHCKEDEFVFRLPVNSDIFKGEGEVRYTGVLKMLDGTGPCDFADPYMGLTLD